MTSFTELPKEITTHILNLAYLNSPDKYKSRVAITHTCKLFKRLFEQSDIKLCLLEISFDNQTLKIATNTQQNINLTALILLKNNIFTMIYREYEVNCQFFTNTYDIHVAKSDKTSTIQFLEYCDEITSVLAKQGNITLKNATDIRTKLSNAIDEKNEATNSLSSYNCSGCSIS